MAEEKKKEGDGKAEEGKKKKGLPPIVLIAVGAIVGGAGVVFAVPPKVVEKPAEVKVYKTFDVTHPDVIQHEFNPRTKAGKSMVRVAFKFVYEVREDLEKAAFEELKKNWEEVRSRSLLLLKTRSFEELNSEAGVRILENDMITELDRILFPMGETVHANGSNKVARVTKVLWDKWLMQ
ncbi:MAG: flagellar basal body-associated FliL family protein [Planctomycetes bacterium]|nr:flagellar basal body-associated FliL family protein [Planctomycetota bacterium]